MGDLLDSVMSILMTSVDDELVARRAEPHQACAMSPRTVRHEARELVAAIVGMTPAQLSASGALQVSPETVSRAERAALRRSRGEPLAYCVGTAAFRHLELQVDARVLIPRPETEIVVDEALNVTRDMHGGIALDIGTGSGAIAIALATEGQFDRVIATDISHDALDVARANASAIMRSGSFAESSTRIEFRHGADLAPLGDIRARLLVSNPPYIALNEASTLPASVRNWEPPAALFALDNGMARYHALVAGAPNVLEPGGWLVLEVDSRRAGQTAALATQSGRYASVRIARDLSGRDRVLVARVR